ncbi:hypothetical protein CC80DRAFT_491234 [Byssothecium circinans]|uniref:Berberine/berberine-like domain-containing protein n=1 Tax=Byssothecium circinans TaxID=147558 RepID=A0A6A5TZ60_9PLEO|nr:hypothetical protein CC80DRAFT_491234 [Byssothecium circinans]
MNAYSGLNPAWRVSPFLHAIFHGWASGSSEQEKADVRNDLTNVKGAAEKAIAPNTGAYMNETDRFDPEWERMFSGERYEEHLTTKQRYDPEGYSSV